MVSFSFTLLIVSLSGIADAAFWTNTCHHQRRPFGITTSSAPQELQYSRDDMVDNDEPVSSTSYFQMQQIPTATSGERLDHIVDCAESGECDIEEMMDMIDELERLNAECEGEHSRECNLDAVAARNVLKVALASKVMVEDAIQDVECAVAETDDPYAAMAEMDDECQPDYYHTVPSDTTERSNKLDRILECAEGTSGECDVEEMIKMVEELEKLNMECESALSRECSLDAVAARNILKVALASKVTMEENVETFANGAQPWANGAS